MNRCIPVISITARETMVFSSVQDAAESYGCRSSDIVKLIERGQLYRDQRTTFDYLLIRKEDEKELPINNILPDNELQSSTNSSEDL